MKRIIIVFNILIVCVNIFSQTTKSSNVTIGKDNLDEIKKSIKGIWKSDSMSSNETGSFIFYKESKLIISNEDKNILMQYTIESFNEVYLLKIQIPQFYIKIFGKNIDYKENFQFELIFDIINEDTIIFIDATKKEYGYSYDDIPNGIIFRRLK